MSFKIVFKPSAIKDLQKQPINIQKRIGKKLKFFIDQNDPLVYAIPLVGNDKAGQYRFRVGDYRIVFDLKESVIIILMIEHRREVYRKK
ncbi:MAG TPA: type II toxin-antitoxin system RelE/ParE family toxin [Candidatus Saccharimonadales bacterium]|nr:type II toxin-antitoxin system RelE/ParE family toxin [Candidatus Saccharimonadales bacterium]